MRRNTVRGLIRSEFVQCADFQASKLEHRVNHIGTSRHINGFPTEKTGVEFLGGVGVACSKLDPAKRPRRVTCYFWHLFPPSDKLQFVVDPSKLSTRVATTN